ncbi:RelA/SpoT domain-containing protein [Streptomyces sp. NBC_00201]|uniref:GTP pyrophosphokinase n=1 Tax=Streptomyces sp. NBC_00201 TaxID=2975679 RepID=UPI00224F06C0|nr:RelA/SpoT domain-containing protein [Streptomyces sp. NBC_00201]MCX5248940.1 RelA/SpoT domain-containing protein [Streptomyces sp. NBC_00201]
MGLIEEFIDRYAKEYDFYHRAARLVAQTLDKDLRSSGIRCIVSYRAKDVERLEEKCRQRAKGKRYRTVEDIFADIADLAGVRVALYFPGEQDQVEKLISQLFDQLEDKRVFPDVEIAKVKGRFSGYSAVHYRVKLREQELGELDQRYAKARIEIQVASVLMHAWSEVQHDLVYKQMGGDLSDQERAILDQLNGLVITGELSLQLLQQAGENRVASNERKFLNHYELAAHLLSHANGLFNRPVGDSALGRVDALFDLLKQAGKSTPAELAPYLSSIHGQLEMRPLAEQVIDALLAEDPSLYKKYRSVREDSHFERGNHPVRDDGSGSAIREFLASWVNLERLLNALAPQRPAGSSTRSTLPINQLLRSVNLSQEVKDDIDFLRRMRNAVVHGRGNEIPDANLRSAAHRINAIIAEIEKGHPTLDQG